MTVGIEILVSILISIFKTIIRNTQMPTFHWKTIREAVAMLVARPSSVVQYPTEENLLSPNNNFSVLIKNNSLQ